MDFPTLGALAQCDIFSFIFRLFLYYCDNANIAAKSRTRPGVATSVGVLGWGEYTYLWAFWDGGIYLFGMLGGNNIIG